MSGFSSQSLPCDGRLINVSSNTASFSTPQTLGGWATAIDDGDSTVTQALSLVVSNDNSALFSVQPALSADGTLTYTTNGSPGTATVAISLTDDSTINGFPALTSAIRTFPISVSVANGTGLAIESIRVLTGGKVHIEFSAISQRIYRIDYSDNLTTWQTAMPALTAAGPLVQRIDQGPPATASPPGTAPRRFYRVSDITP